MMTKVGAEFIERAIERLDPSYRTAMARLALEGYTMRPVGNLFINYWVVNFPHGKPWLTYTSLPAAIDAACAHLYGKSAGGLAL